MPTEATPLTLTIAQTAKCLKVGRKRAAVMIREGKLRLLGGNPGRKERMPMNSQVLTNSIREALELPLDAPLPPHA